MKLIILTLLSITASLVIPCAAAAPSTRRNVQVDEAAVPIPAPKENRIVRYTYSPDVIFRILTVSNLHTHIELGEDEGVKETPTIGDSAQWRVTGGPRNLYLKPLRGELETSMTVVTNKRTYQFQLIAGKKSDSAVFQKVSFLYPDRDVEVKLRKDAEVASVEAEKSRLGSQIIAANTDPASLDFGFIIDGEASFRPTSVYSDGRFTYLRMPNTQDSPAVFLMDQAGNPSLINYKTKDNLIIVERVIQRLLLKLGSVEVKVTQQGFVSKKAIW